MTYTLCNFPAELEDALYSLAIADRAPSATELDELTRAYPEHAADLVEIVVELVAEASSGDDDFSVLDETTSLAMSRAMSQFNNRLHGVTSSKTAPVARKATPDAAPRNIFISLSRDALQVRAKELRVNMLFIVKLRDRVIDPTTFTVGFITALADICREPADAVRAHLGGPSIVSQPAFYKAGKKPEVGRRQSFEEAVRESGLSKEQQDYLLSL